MKKKRHVFPHFDVLLCLLFFIFMPSAKAQLTNYQQTTTKCYTGATVSMGNTTGTLVGNVGFTTADIPLGHKIVDVVVEIVWTKSDNGFCTSITGVPADVGAVGFVLQGPFGSVRYLAASNLIGPYVGTSSSFMGLANIVQDTIVFKDGGNSLLPAGLPTLGRDTVHPNLDALHFYCGNNPHGLWRVGGIDDAPSYGPQLCIHSYCITIVTCDATQLKASCKVNPMVGVGATGTHLFEFADLDSISDVSCLVENITFSPTTISCSDIGSSIPVTMTIRDHLDSVESCVSLVQVIDNVSPVISQCFPTVLGTHYLDATGRDTFWASSILASDNCGILTKEVRPLSGGPWSPFLPINCIIGPYQFEAQVTDSSGNVSNCTIMINVIDTIAPTAVCGQDTAYLSNSPNGVVTVLAVNVDGGSLDACPPIFNHWIGSQFALSPIYTCADLGINTVRLIVADASGNLDTCDNALITILDTIKPVAVCGNDSIYLNQSGVATLFASHVGRNSIDNCGIDSLNINGLSSINFNCSHINNSQQVRLNLFDLSGNRDSCISLVTVLDTFPPIASCRNRSIYLDAAGTAIVYADSLNNGSIDLCTGTSLSFAIAGNTTAILDCSNLNSNPNLITLTVSDSFGNSSTCTASVSVLDTIAPLAICRNTSIYLNNSGIASLYAADLSAGSTDNCSVTDSFVNLLGNPFINYTCLSIFMPQSATLIVTDAQGNTASCVETITVIDTIRPMALCKATVVAQLDAAGVVTVLPTALDSNSTDNCGLVEYLINNTSSVVYTCADLGTQSANLTVRDSFGNIAVCAASIIIQDNIAPTVSCQTKTIYLNNLGTSTLTPDSVLVFPATNDNCGIATTTFLTGNTITYTCDSLGARMVEVLVTDNFGSTSTCLTTVTVVDTIAPIASCRSLPFILQLNSNGVNCMTALDIDNGSSDVCNLETLLINGIDSFCFNCTNLGSNTVVLSALDSSGNQSTCTANVLVRDSINPMALCQDTSVYLGATGVATLFAADIDAGSSDNCSFTTSINNQSSITYTCNQVGGHSEQLTIIDIAGNQSQCTADITVLDTIVPIANCIAGGNLNVYLDSNCFASVSATIFNNGSTDNCTLTNTSYTVGGLLNASFTAANLATNPNVITLSVTDSSGNSTTCTTDITVRDSISSILTCVADTIELGLLGNATLLPTMVLGTVTGNCNNNLIYTLNGGQDTVNFTCLDTGSNPITLTATDSSGNASFCTTSVFVEDKIAPTANCRSTQTLNLNPGGTFGVLNVGMIDLGSSDNCSISTHTLSQDTFRCADIYANPHTVILRLTDANGNTDSCTSQITVRDNTNPTVSCQTAVVYLGTGITNVNPGAVIIPPTGDNCTPLSSYFAGQGSNISYTCDSIGAHSVTVVVSDLSGNNATCTTTITVLDRIKPVAICKNDSIYLNSNGVATLFASDMNNNSSDNCGIDSMNINGLPSINFDCSSVNNNQQVRLIIFDLSGNTDSCMGLVTVLDTFPPIANCKATVVAQLDAAGVVSVLPTALDSNSTDNCGLVEYLINNASSMVYTCADLGTQSANLTVRDSSGNTSVCASSIIIQDTIPPIASCQTRTIYMDASGTIILTPDSVLVFPATNDNCGIATTTFSTGNTITYTCDSIGTRMVQVLVTDNFGNTASCRTTITLLDTIAPIASCRPLPFAVQLDSFGVACVTPFDIDNGSSDVCTLDSLLINGLDSFCFNCTNLGANTLVLSVLDPSGNQSTCTATVFVSDSIPPRALCQDTIIYLDATGVASLQPLDVNNGSIDNCTIISYSLSQDTFDCNDLVSNPHAVQLYVVDQSGNADTCTTQVTVQDTISPTAVCQNDTLYFSGLSIHINATSLDAGSFDNCGIQSLVLSQDSFDCTDIGMNLIPLTITDHSGNSTTCTANVLILDTTALAIAGATQLLCSTDSTTLNASAASSPLVGTWTTNSGATIVNPNTANTLVTDLFVGLNVFYWTLSSSACSNLSTDSVLIEVVSISSDTAYAGVDQNLCQDTITTLVASSVNNSTGEWRQTTAQSNAGVVIDNPSDSLSTLSGLISGNAYTFVWELSNGSCGIYSRDTVVITIDDTPSDQADAGPDVTCSPDTINLAASFSMMGVGQWSSPSNVFVEDSSSITSIASNFTQDTTMMIWSLSNGFCVDYSSDTMYVILDATWPVALMDSFNLISDGTISTVDVILNDTLPSNWDIFIQTPMTDGLMRNLNNGRFEIEINQTVLNQYFVYEICNTDCPNICDTALVRIAIQPVGDCYAPTAFTPNNDGQNDFFVIPCLENTNERAHLRIFNRWGSLVFETDNYISTWDGTHQNQPLPDGVYFYILQIEVKTPQNGSIEIKR